MRDKQQNNLRLTETKLKVKESRYVLDQDYVWHTLVLRREEIYGQ